MSALLGHVIDERYELLAQLGAGGMGTVYRAIQHPFEREVALKMLRELPDMDTESLARFEREALAMSKLKHKNIVMFYGYGTYHSAPYMVMELVHGEPLQHQLRTSTPLDSQYTLRIIEQVAEGLSCAHANGLVHRDLKPSNIMIVDDEHSLQVKIIDFGLARVMPSFGREMQKLTEAGHAVGSALYMSPEQCQGRATDARSDIYALGCILHHCLTGRPPFDGEHSVVVMQHHVSDLLPRMGDVAPDLQAVVDRATEKAPGDRYQTVDELLLDVRSLLAGHNVCDETRDSLKNARAQQAAASAVRPKGGNSLKLLLVASSILVIAAGGYVVGLGLGYGSGGGAQSSARADDTVWMLNREASDAMAHGDNVHAINLYERVLLEDKHRMRLLNLDERDAAHSNLITLYLREKRFAQARNQCQHLLTMGGPRILGTSFGCDLITKLMTALDQLGQQNEANEYLKTAVEEMRSNDLVGWETYADWLVLRLSAQQRPREAYDYGKHAYMLSENPPSKMSLMFETACAAVALKNTSEAERLLRQADAIGSEYDFSNVRLLHTYAQIKLSLNKLPEARKLLDFTAENKDGISLVGPTLAECCVRQGDYAAAQQALKDTLKVRAEREPGERREISNNVIAGCERIVAILDVGGKKSEQRPFKEIESEARSMK